MPILSNPTATIRDALIARLVDAGVVRVYRTNAVPASPTYPYAVLGMAPAAPQLRTLDGSGDPAARFTIQMVGRTDDSVLSLAELAFLAFDDVALTEVTGAPVAWQEVASDVYRDADDAGVLNITQTYRY